MNPGTKPLEYYRDQYGTHPIFNTDRFVIGCIMMFDGTGWVDNSTIPGWYACIPENAGQGCPDMVNRFVMGKVVAGTGATGGANSVTLATANLPSHSHTINHDHGSFTSGESTGSTGTQSASHSHTINHDHAGFSSDNQSASHKHDTYIGSHVHNLYAYNDDSVRGAGAPSLQTNIHELSGHVKSFDYGTKQSGDQLTSHNHWINVPNFSGSSSDQSASHTHSLNSHTHSINPPNFTGSSGSAGSGTAHENRPAYYSMIFIRKCA